MQADTCRPACSRLQLRRTLPQCQALDAIAHAGGLQLRSHLQRLMEQVIELAGQVLLVGVLPAAQGGEEISHR